jgi:formylglycine-generating enzyme required for sulfatase activity
MIFRRVLLKTWQRGLFAALALVAVLIIVANLRSQTETRRQPIPPAGQVTKSQGLVQEIYGQEIDAATSADAKVALARKLLEVERTTKNDSDAWALLLIARRLATSAGDVGVIRQSCLAMGARFDVDHFVLEAESLLGVPEDLADSAKLKTVQRMQVLIRAGLAREDFSIVRRLAEAANRQATAARNLALARETLDQLDRLSEIAPLFDEAKEAREILKVDPTDAAASLKQGRYLCFVLGEFQKGGPYLQRSEDPTLAPLASREAATASAPEDIVGVADAWWEYASKLDEFASVKTKVHAVELYSRALPNLTGLSLAKAEARIRELGSAAHTTGARPAEDGFPGTDTAPLGMRGQGLPVQFPYKAPAARKAQESWARELGFDSWQVKSKSGLQLVVVPPGTLLMGTPASEPERTPAEGPQHEVRISKAMLVGAHEITQQKFEDVMGYNPRYYRQRPEVRNLNVEQFPVENISWWDACEFCNQLSKREDLSEYYRLTDVRKGAQGILSATVEVLGGSGYRLPTEAEFEHFARAGTTTPFSFGSVHDGSQGNLLGTKPYGTTRPGVALHRTTTVGSYEPNPFGIYDVDGNVSEWCWDYYDPFFYARLKRNVPMVDPQGPANGVLRCNRSNAFAYDAKHGRSGRRHGDKPDFRSQWGGLRVVRNLE